MADNYTPETLAVVCSICKAAVTGKCMDTTWRGTKYMDEPHPDRVRAGLEASRIRLRTD
jgi:hypothetical protein